MTSTLADKLEVALVNLEILLGDVAERLESEDAGVASDDAAFCAREVAAEINVDDRLDRIVNQLRRLAKLEA